MSGTKDIEARLDRSLQNQVRAPSLDRRFDAAVWARIAREESTARVAVEAVPSRAVRASRWLTLVNTLGIAVTLGVALYFALGSFGGMETPPLKVGLNVPMPMISDDTAERIVTVLGQALGAAALILGLSLTSFGRRVRASFS
jgi:hypothetical protein